MQLTFASRLVMVAALAACGACGRVASDANDDPNGAGGANGSSTPATGPLGSPTNPYAFGEPLATLDAQVSAITMDADSLYVATPDSVLRIARDGSSAPVTLASSGIAFEGNTVAVTHGESITLDAVNVYWTARDNGRITMVPKAGGDVVVLADGQSQPSSIAVDDRRVYWTNNGGDSTPSNPTGAVMAVPINLGAGPTVIVDKLLTPSAIAIDGDGIVFKELLAIGRVAKTGGVVTPIDARTKGFTINDLVVEGGHVFYPSEGSLFSAKTDGSEKPKLLTPVSAGANIAVLGDVVYFIGPPPPERFGTILTVPVTGGSPALIGLGGLAGGYLVQSTYKLLVDAKTIYWVEYVIGEMTGEQSFIHAVVR